MSLTHRSDSAVPVHVLAAGGAQADRWAAGHCSMQMQLWMLISHSWSSSRNAMQCVRWYTRHWLSIAVIADSSQRLIGVLKRVYLLTASYVTIRVTRREKIIRPISVVTIAVLAASVLTFNWPSFCCDFTLPSCSHRFPLLNLFPRLGHFLLRFDQWFRLLRRSSEMFIYTEHNIVLKP